MKHAQKIQWVGLIMAILLFLFPPFHHPYGGFGGFHFLLTYWAQRGQMGRVDEIMLLMEEAISAAAFYFWYSNSQEVGREKLLSASRRSAAEEAQRNHDAIRPPEHGPVDMD